MTNRAKTRDHDSWLLEKLSDPEKAEAYLNAASQDSPEMFLVALRNVAQAQRQMTSVAKEAGVARESLYRALSRDGNPRLDTLRSVLRVLGFDIHVAVKEPQVRGGAAPAHSTRVLSMELDHEVPLAAKIEVAQVPSKVTRIVMNECGVGKTTIAINAFMGGFNMRGVAVAKPVDWQQSASGALVGFINLQAEPGRGPKPQSLAPLDCVIAKEEANLNLIRKYGSPKI